MPRRAIARRSLVSCRCPTAPALLARGPWPLDQVDAHWREDAFEPPAEHAAAADAAIAALRDRGSPSHDGVAARLVGYARRATARCSSSCSPRAGRCASSPGDASASLVGAVRHPRRRRPLARRPPRGVAVVAGRAAGRSAPAARSTSARARRDTLVRELDEEWSVAPERCVAEALVRLPHGMVMFVGQAWLPAGAEVTPDHEHDAHAWWPADPDDWPDEADEPLRRMAHAAARERLQRPQVRARSPTRRSTPRCSSGALTGGETLVARLDPRARLDRHERRLPGRRAARASSR